MGSDTKTDRSQETKDDRESEKQNDVSSEYFRFIEQVNQFILLSKWTRRDLSRAAGISQGTLSQFMSGKYPGDSDGIRRKLADILERENDKSDLTYANPKYIETSISKRFVEIARMCHLFNEIGVCYGDAGLGKTEAAREYVNRRSDAIMIESNPGYSPSVLFHELHDKLGGGGRTTLHNTFSDCVHRLENTGRLIIIDEAEHLPYKSLEMVRRLHDHTGIGILLTGMRILIDNLKGIRGEYAQLYSRVGIAGKLAKLKPEDTENIVKRITGDTNGLWRIFHQECHGVTRRLFKLINRSQFIADKNNRPITTEVIQKAVSIVAVERMS